MADKNADAPVYNRASQYVKGIGVSLDTLQGRDLLLRSYEVSERAMKGNETTFVALNLSEMEAGQPSTEVIEAHAWSASLAEKLSEIPQSALPVIVQFVRVPTSAGFRVWSIV